jgi:hypothetical protein
MQKSICLFSPPQALFKRFFVDFAGAKNSILLGAGMKAWNTKQGQALS